MDKWRKPKLFLNLILTAGIFTYFLAILILLLNPHISITSSKEFFLLYRDLFVFYGPLWFVIVGAIFFIIQFFSEKKYPIGLFSPPTITYFLAFTILIAAVILFFNYDYYLALLAHNVKAKFIKLLLINLTLVIVGILFVFYKRISKKWLQITFLIIFVVNMISSYSSVISTSHLSQQTKPVGILPPKIHPPQLPIPLPVNEDEEQEQLTPEESPQRKIRIVMMDGLSLKILLSLSSEDKLLNFRHLLNKGVHGRVTTFSPNLNLSLINSALTGLRPAEFIFHANKRYKFTGLHHEFDIFPRYIFFRNSAMLGFTSFYKRNKSNFIDNIAQYFENNNYKTDRLINPPFAPKYAHKSLHRKSSFMLRFSEMLKIDDKKYEILKKAFFYDDYLKNLIPTLKDSDGYYSVIRFPGLGIISKYYYQYYDPDQLFSRIPETDIKKYGPILEKYYDYYDSIIGNLMTSTGDNELLVILSFFEYEPLPVWRRILVNLSGQEDIYVYKSLHSPGTILLYENSALKKGYPLKTTSILDIFPTLIYYSGFQLSKNLQGTVIREIFTKEFQLNNPIDIHTNYNNR
ncbi:MAG: alkaline phosphatase family protein [Candidatus Aminicenantes bacterium]|nr:alkaline phosphatase family protein [Candidatus Aminicenantes bacterium]